tara:strand:+ start:2900 stop:3877 length:978 start_codon:yes stop_codon:yes gene_type:complete
MKLLSYKIKETQTHQIGVLKREKIYNLNYLFGDINLIEVFQIDNFKNKISYYIGSGNAVIHSIKNINFLPPIPNPNSFRDAYAFKEHVETCRKNRGAKLISEFERFPVFYFSNHNSMYAHNENIELMPDHFNCLDYELEIAVIIGVGGKNILSKDAENHIAGFCILNDISARTLQMEEMKLNLGPAKGKDFANVIGPYIVTPEELEEKAHNTKFGKKYNLKMQCYVNGKLLSEGNAKSMHWTFAEIIERASYGVDLFPGDIIGSGTVGTGCLLEINGTNKRNDSNYNEKWLKEGDEITMKVEMLGSISNKISKSKNKHSILKLKK